MSICFTLGAALALLVLVILPDVYLEIADRCRWRLGLPAVNQLQMEATLVQAQLRGDSVIGSRATLLFGDSHLYGLPASALGDSVTNYAIAGESASRLAERIGRYHSVRQARRVVLLSGSNDLAAGISPVAAADSLTLVMRQIPSEIPVFLIEVPPTRSDTPRNVAGSALNLELAQRCLARPHCQLLTLSALADSHGQLRADHDSGDGIHLSTIGYRVLVDKLTEALRQVDPKPPANSTVQ